MNHLPADDSHEISSFIFQLRHLSFDAVMTDWCLKGLFMNKQRMSYLFETVIVSMSMKLSLGHVAYLRVQSRALLLYFFLSCNHNLAISGTNGSFGLGSVSKVVMDSNTKT